MNDERRRIEELFTESFEQQEADVDGAKNEVELAWIVAYYQGYRAALRELHPDVEDLDV